MADPGADALPMSLAEFHACLRGGAVWRASNGEVPAALAANRPDFKEPLVSEYTFTGTSPPIGELIDGLMVNWIKTTDACQIGVCMPFDNRPQSYRLLLVSVDPTGYLAEHAVFGIDGRLLLLDKMEGDSSWSIAEWQTLLAANLEAAGHEHLGKGETRPDQGFDAGL